MLLQINTPVPRDIPLNLPLPEWLLVTLLVISFLLHILFVNLMVGGSVLTLWGEIKGLKNKDYDRLANEIAKTITVNKSMAVVLGVAPLLSINALYTVYFYSANALTGIMWILIIPLVSIAFLLTYLHKYTWDAMADVKWLHIGVMALATGLFLFIPLIFLVNVNLMLFPEKWASVKGFASALTLPNVLPRYLHFLCASMAATGLFIFWYMGRRNYDVEGMFKNLTRYDIQKMGYSLALAASVIQFLVGPIVLVTLPSKGVGWNLIVVILLGACIALPAMWWMWKGINGPKEAIGQNFGKVLTAMSLVIVFMGSGRHVYRANALNPHRKLMAAQTSAFEKISRRARENPAKENTELKIDPALGEVAVGEAIFKQNCAACHQEKEKLVGPAVTEMATIYSGNAGGLKSWIKAPGKKRADYPQMPGFPQIPDEDLNELAKYILSIRK